MKRSFLTTPIYYVNARPHLGHAYTTTVVDAVARMRRGLGQDVFFLTGTDEHGDKIVKAAAKAGVSPKEYVDEVSASFRALWPSLDVDYDHFVRTTDEGHKACVREALQRVYDAGDIYHGSYTGLYCTGCERFLTEKELVDGLCPDHKVAPDEITEKNYFFRMSKYQDRLLEHIKANPDFIRPEGYRHEVVALLESGALEDLCISRPKSRLTWGVELPFDQDYVAYVWFDALLNYVCALGWPSAPDFAERFATAEHVIAKDIVKPHAVFWPTMLMALGMPLYKHLNVHGYWLMRDQKMSKSLGNVVDPLSLAEKHSVASFRYFLLREMSFGSDSSFSEDAFEGRFNADLANDLGNCFNRTLSMVHKYFDGTVPPKGTFTEAEDELMELSRNACENYFNLFSRFQTARAIESLWEFIRFLNKYIDTQAPWKLFKEENTGRLGTVMYAVLEGLRKAAACVYPIMPSASRTMLAQLGVSLPDSGPDLMAETGAYGLLPEGVAVAHSSTLFPRIEREKAAPVVKEPKAKAEKQAKADKPAAKAAAAEVPDEIAFEDFAKVDLRVGTVLSADPVEGADKLYRLLVDLGEPEPRQIVSGIREHYQPDQLVGRQVVLVTNLAPRKLRGVVSHGMILAVRHDNGLALLGPSDAVHNGAKVS